MEITANAPIVASPPADQRVAFGSMPANAVAPATPPLQMPTIVGHRGYRGPDNRAGNVMSAFHKAADLGVGTIEFDIRKTADGELIIHHDAHAGARLISHTSRADLPLVEGETIPTLDDVLNFAKQRGLRMNVELKEAGYEKEVLDHVLAKFDPAQFSMISFKRDAITAIEHLKPEVKTGLLLYELPLTRLLQHTFLPNRPINLARKVGADFVAIHTKMATDTLLNRAQQANLPVVVWTVDKPKDLQRLVRDPRVTQVITDVPDLAQAIGTNAK